MMRGSTAADAADRILTIGFLPLALPHFSLATISAAAPSFTPEALPAVTTPPSKSGFNLTSDSIVASRRGCSSFSTMTGGASFLPPGSATGRISPLKKPSASALAYFCCEASANSSASSRVISYSLATLSAVCGMAWSPNIFATFGFVKREPIVESYIFESRPKAVEGLPITYGARVMLSVPPAM